MTNVNLTGRKLDREAMKVIKDKKAFFDIPQDVREKQYRGCGHGFVVIEKATGKVVFMSYLDENGNPSTEQNISMHPMAGMILKKMPKHIQAFANFSCGQACLF